MRSPSALVPPAQVSSGENSPRKLQNVVADSRAIYRRHFAVMILTVASRLNSERKSRKMESCLTKTMVARTESERQDSLADSTDAMLNLVSRLFVFLRVFQDFAFISPNAEADDL